MKFDHNTRVIEPVSCLTREQNFQDLAEERLQDVPKMLQKKFITYLSFIILLSF